MAFFFLDSNIIIKYYYTEPGSTWVRTLINDEANICLISEIAFPEVAAALAQLRAHRRFGRLFLTSTFQRFEEAVANGLFLNQLLTTEILYHAATLALAHAIKGYDSVQISSALATQPKISGDLVFVSGDQQALRVAETVGLITEDPFAHVMPEDQRR
ncbi:MAG: type II toxin-antitoxin system VapC family toxin [Caldilineaceae bacterium]